MIVRLRKETRPIIAALGLFILALSAAPRLCAQGTYTFAPSDSSVKMTLDATLHTVHGEFRLKRGEVQFDPASGAISGEIVVDAASGHTGNDTRDARMHREILESARYPDIVFHPKRMEGKVDPQGTSTVQVQGMFSVHGEEHEITIPVQIELKPGHWTASAHFAVPFVKWGMKNPSNFFVKVGQNVEIDLEAAGTRP